MTTAIATAMPTAADSADIPWAAVAPLIALAVAFLAYCLYDLGRSEVRYLPKWAWALICLVSIPVGGIIYLALGRAHR